MRTRRRRRPWSAVTFALTVAIVTAACGTRVPKTSPSTLPPATAPISSASTPTTTGAETTTSPPTTTATTAATAPADPAAATAQIKANWEKFFDKSTSIQDRLALLQNAQALRQALEQRAKDPLQQQATASVKSVMFTSPTEANVTYDVLLNGQVALPGAQGQAVLDQGVWKVSSASFCSLISLGATAPIPGCS